MLKNIAGLMKRLSKQQITMQQTNTKSYNYVLLFTMFDKI